MHVISIAVPPLWMSMGGQLKDVHVRPAQDLGAVTAPAIPVPHVANQASLYSMTYAAHTRQAALCLLASLSSRVLAAMSAEVGILFRLARSRQLQCAHTHTHILLSTYICTHTHTIDKWRRFVKLLLSCRR